MQAPEDVHAFTRRALYLVAAFGPTAMNPPFLHLGIQTHNRAVGDPMGS